MVSQTRGFTEEQAAQCHMEHQQTPQAPCHLQKGDHEWPEGEVGCLLQFAVKFLDGHRGVLGKAMKKCHDNLFLFLDTWEMAPDKQNWEADCICHYRLDRVCIKSCLTQPGRLRPAEQKRCTRQGVKAAHSQALPGPAASHFRGQEAGTSSGKAAGPSWHLLYPGQVA